MAEFRRNRGRKSPRKRGGAVKVLASELAQTRHNLGSLFEMAADCPEAMKGPISDVELKRSLPTADQIVLAEMSLPRKHEYLMVMRTIGQRALASLAPRIVWKAARKMEDHLEPGDTRLIVEYLKGMGFFEPSTPMTDDEREKKMKKHADYERMTLDDLKKQVLEGRV